MSGQCLRGITAPSIGKWNDCDMEITARSPLLWRCRHANTIIISSSSTFSLVFLIFELATGRSRNEANGAVASNNLCCGGQSFQKNKCRLQHLRNIMRVWVAKIVNEHWRLTQAVARHRDMLVPYNYIIITRQIVKCRHNDKRDVRFCSRHGALLIKYTIHCTKVIFSNELTNLI